MRLGLFAHFKLVHGGQNLGRFCRCLKHYLCFTAGKLLIPVRNVGSRVILRHGQVEPCPDQHGEHFSPHFFKGKIFQILPGLFLAVLPCFMASSMVCFMKLGGVVFF